MRFMLRGFLTATLVLAVLACSGDPQTPSEPVTASGTEAASADPGNTQPVEEAIPNEAPSNTADDTPGSLTDDPYGAPQMPQGSGDEAAPAEGTAPSTTDDYNEAFESDLESGDTSSSSNNTPDSGINNQKPSSNKKTKSGKYSKGGKSGKKLTRYVNATLLNVRSKPNAKAPIVRRLLGGAKVEVEIHGQFAKIKEGQWCRTKFLSETPTKKVSRSEAEGAWKNSKYKDNWKPAKK